MITKTCEQCGSEYETSPKATRARFCFECRADRGRARCRSWYERNAAMQRERCLANYHADPEPARERNRQWMADNAERRKAWKRAYAEENRDRILAYARDYAQRNPEANRRAAHIRRVRERDGDIREVTEVDLRRLLDRYGNACAYCGSGHDLTLDHVVPVSRGGRHAIGNLVPACRSCNSSKGPKLLVEFRVSR